MNQLDLYLVRHGQTEANKAHTMLGRRDIPLNGVGRSQVRQAAEWLREQGVVFDAAYSSPLSRARETACIIVKTTGSKGVAVTSDDRLLEMDYGPYEGADLHHLPAQLLRFFSDFVHEPAPQGMEQLAHVVARTGSFLEDVRTRWERAGSHQHTVLVTTHAIALKGALEYLDPSPHGERWNEYLGNGDIYRVTLAPQGWGRPQRVFAPER